MAEITIKQEPSVYRDLATRVSSYSFRIRLIPGFSPYPQETRDITVQTHLEKILDGYAILVVNRKESFSYDWNGRESRTPLSNTTQFGIEPVLNPNKIDQRLYDEALRELKKFQDQGYQFTIKDETKYSSEPVIAHHSENSSP